jgi:hypothetical protein
MKWAPSIQIVPTSTSGKGMPPWTMQVSSPSVCVSMQSTNRVLSMRVSSQRRLLTERVGECYTQAYRRGLDGPPNPGGVRRPPLGGESHHALQATPTREDVALASVYRRAEGRVHVVRNKALALKYVDAVIGPVGQKGLLEYLSLVPGARRPRSRRRSASGCRTGRPRA